ncbi:extracellular solute-binding protein [Paenibacillus thermotolerans]|uniref:extracellular solute-binding protein n=1 Tax=Paenibacillus thermotolerans TaxID=3027807 RepID=UPI002367FAFB|nr:MULTISPECIES: extracellular solute-binding protein [unclassified Paenibacillus]
MINRFRKSFALSLSLVLTFGVIAGCSVGGNNEGQSSSVKPDETKAQEPTKKEEKRIPLSMFMSNSGAPHPDGVDPSNNPFINIIEDYANVDLIVEVPAYTDEMTKLNLLLSSGNLPDIVHARVTEAPYEAARNGAFIDLKKYYDNSPIVQKVITPEMMELAKDDITGKYFRIPMAWDKIYQGYGNIVRYDMIQKYNAGKWPESVEEWIELLRKIHKAEPNAILITNRVIGDYGITYAGNAVFQWFGARPFSYRVENGKVINTFRTPEYKAAVEVMKQLYAEGIVDKEFATTDSPKYSQHLVNDNTIMWSDSATQIMPMASSWEKQDATKGRMLLYQPPFKTLPSVVKDVKYTYPKLEVPISSHGMYISSKSKDPDRAWKVIEGFATDQLREAIFWGKEGDTYTVKDGNRVIDENRLNDPQRAWSLQLATLFGFHNDRNLKVATAAQVMKPDYLDMMIQSLDEMDKQAQLGGISVTSFIQLPDNESKKVPESRTYITQATIEAMMGRITMAEFDERVQGYVEKYGFIDDYYTKEMTERKDELRKRGVIEVDW